MDGPCRKRSNLLLDTEMCFRKKFSTAIITFFFFFFFLLFCNCFKSHRHDNVWNSETYIFLEDLENVHKTPLDTFRYGIKLEINIFKMMNDVFCNIATGNCHIISGRSHFYHVTSRASYCNFFCYVSMISLYCLVSLMHHPSGTNSHRLIMVGFYQNR